MAVYTFNNTSTGRTGTIQSWTVPSSGSYTIVASGAQGGNGNNAGVVNAGGLGARITGTFSLTAGHIIQVLVGQQGTTTTATDSGAGGGGGTFIYNSTTATLLIAAGGGGGGGDSGGAGKPGSATTTATPPTYGTFPAAGTAGNGGNAASYSGAGAGWNTSGATGGSTGMGGTRFLDGGTGGTFGSADGGFGGGGAGGYTTYDAGGGGGGYTGGAGAASDGDGGGAGSYNGGSTQTNEAGIQSSHGIVTITSLTSGDTLDGVATPTTITMVADLYVGPSFNRYFRWTTIPNQMDVATVVNVGASTDTGVWTSVLTGRTAGTTYYYQAYVSNGTTTNYGAIKSVTLPLGIASSKSYTPSALTTTTATLVGAILDMNQ